MAEAFTMTQDIVEEHRMRMLHIRKYYPFFKIMETSFAQYREGKYADLDMGYITLAVLRFFMEENQFYDREVTYAQYEVFMEQLLRRDFHVEPDEALIGYIFDKLKNDGRPFLFPYYDPVEYKKKVMRVKLLDSRMEGQTVYYSVTAEAIEFYLDTKEFRDESTITTEQLLLEKMLHARNFKGGTQVVRRINHEVTRLMAKKNEVLGILSCDVFEGIKAYEQFMQTGTRWFAEEQKQFEKNQNLVRLAMERAQQDERKGDYQSQYYRAMQEIHELEQEMRQAMAGHEELLRACTDLQLKADELVSKARLRALRPAFDFQGAVGALIRQNRADRLESLVAPLLKLQVKKTFSLRMIDEMLSYRPEKEEAPELVEHSMTEQYRYEDEIEEERIVHNFQIIMTILLQLLAEKESFTLKEFCGELAGIGQTALLKNGDFYTFLVHLTQKKTYVLQQVVDNPDTFLEEIIRGMLAGEGQSKGYGVSAFGMETLDGEEFAPDASASVTNIRFVKE